MEASFDNSSFEEEQLTTPRGGVPTTFGDQMRQRQNRMPQDNEFRAQTHR